MKFPLIKTDKMKTISVKLEEKELQELWFMATCKAEECKEGSARQKFYNNLSNKLWEQQTTKVFVPNL